MQGEHPMNEVQLAKQLVRLAKAVVAAKPAGKLDLSSPLKGTLEYEVAWHGARRMDTVSIGGMQRVFTYRKKPYVVSALLYRPHDTETWQPWTGGVKVFDTETNSPVSRSVQSSVEKQLVKAWQTYWDKNKDSLVDPESIN